MAKIKSGSTDSHKTRPRGVSKQKFERVYWPYLPMVLVISVLLAAGSAGGGLRPALKHPFGKVLSYATSMSVSNLLSDSNAARLVNGVHSLKLNSKLNAAAQAQADDMAARNYWSHDTPEGNPPWIWVTDQGYSYQKLGQNLATGFSDEQTTVDGWMASPPHRENLLDSSFTDVGFGYANNPNYTSAGGGPMTIVVAFYGEPQVLAANTTAPAAHPTAPQPAAPAPSPATAPAPASTKPAAAATEPAAKKPKVQPDTTSAPAAAVSAPKKASRLQLAAPGFSYGGLATKVSLLLAAVLGLFLAGRHARAIRKFIIEGERYAVQNPLTDLGLVVIACLLFILSQTAGLIQ